MTDDDGFDAFWSQQDPGTGMSYEGIYGQRDAFLMVWQASRQQALEEAASEIEAWQSDYANGSAMNRSYGLLASAIRSLKSASAGSR